MAEKNDNKNEIVGQTAWRRGASVLLVLWAFCLAACVYGLAPIGSSLWEPMSHMQPFGPDTLKMSDNTYFEGLILPLEGENEYSVLGAAGASEKVVVKPGADELNVRHLTVRPMLVVSAVFFVILAGLLLKFLGRRMVYPKPAQGKWVRASILGSLLALSLFGSYELYYSVHAGNWWGASFYEFDVLGRSVAFRHMLFPSAAVFLLMGVVCYLIFTSPRIADFQIETEGELKKVSWPSRKDYMGSSAVVLVVSVILALFLYFSDLALTHVMKAVGIGF